MFEPAPLNAEFQSLYRYNSSIRSLILKVKIEGNYRALACLKYLFLNSPLSDEMVEKCDRIIPAPSSLWSRLRGRIDLAWMLGDSLAGTHKLSLRPAPLQLHWQLKKRSQLSNREKLASCSPLDETAGEKSVLIVDDVVTSGYTLRRTATALKGENCRFLTLASAFHT